MVAAPFEGDGAAFGDPMVRLPLALAFSACAFLLAGCDAADPARDETAAEAIAGPGGVVPTDYDWHFTLEGGSGDLDFGDGDWAEGDRLMSMSCLPNSQEVRLALGDEPDVVLTSGTATGTFRNDTPVAANHPVFAALRAGQALAVGSKTRDQTLEAKAAGKRDLETFFAYCTQPLPVPVTEPDPAQEAPSGDRPAPPTLASEGDDKADDLAGVKPVEPGVDVVEGDGPAHQPVNR